MPDEANSTTAPDVHPRPPADDTSTTVLAEAVLDGRYRLQNRVARRGPVALWRGDDQVLARPVAVRVLAHAESESSAGRLIAAAVRSGRLVHAGAASTYDATTTETPSGTVAYVVSEWVDGSTLTAMLEDGPLSPERSARIVLAVARVLVAAHARQLTHGDLHPGDVVLTPHGGVKVLDIEVRAALTDEVAEASFEERRVRDVRALGALLYACLTGRWPLPGDRGLPEAPLTSDGTLCTPRQVRAGVPRDLDTIALNALEAGPDSDSPLQAAADVVEALESMPLGSGGADRTDPYASVYNEDDVASATLVEPHLGGSLPTPHRRRVRTRRIVIPLVLLLVCAVIAWLLGVAMGRLPGPSSKLPSISPSENRPGPALTLTSVRSFDPQGDGAEQESTVPLAHDGDQATGWTTDTYRTSNFGNLKSGVGLRIDFGSAEKVQSARLAFAQAGQSVELRAGDSESADIGSYPVVAQVVGAGKDVELTPTQAAAHRYWVVWVTQLPQTDRGFRAELDEMVFLS
ncbi:MAG TPA: protein kinase family protein [Frankiaceae bacterium]|nr:protein kinase family protein [Frankiaceae bacterium]